MPLIVHIAWEFEDEKKKDETIKAVYKISGNHIVSMREEESEDEITKKDLEAIALTLDELDKGESAKIFLNSLKTVEPEELE